MKLPSLPAGALQRLLPGVEKLVFMTGAAFEVDGADFYVTRSGYTGEDGFEISLPAHAAEAFRQAIGSSGVLLMPVSSHGALPLDDQDAAHVSIGTFSRASNYLGTPAIALPAGFDEAQMPIGVQLLSPVSTDMHLLNMASAMAPA